MPDPSVAGPIVSPESVNVTIPKDGTVPDDMDKIMKDELIKRGCIFKLEDAVTIGIGVEAKKFKGN